MKDQIKRHAGVLPVLIALACATLQGCQPEDNVIQGIWIPRADGPSTAEFRIETEIIPNAQRVTEDTMPQWQLGRYAFKEGVDQLLVVSRITSYLEKLTPEQEEDGVKPRRLDRILERVWITIPLGTQLGEELVLEDLQRKHLLDYDEGEPGAEMFVQPNQVYGKLTLLDERADAVVFKIDMRVESKRLPSWNCNGILEVPIKINGVRATPAKPDALTEYQSVHKKKAAGEATPKTDSSSTSEATSTSDGKAAATDASSPEVAQQGQTPTTQPSTNESGQPPAPAPTTPPATGESPEAAEAGPTSSNEGPAGAEAQAAGERSIVGQWLVDTPDIEYRFQFHDDGSFVYSNIRRGGSYAPGMGHGTYEVMKGESGDVLLLHLTRWEFNEQDHMHFLTSKHLGYMLHWADTDLVLNGPFIRPKENQRLRFHPAQYPDMRDVLPPKGGRAEE